MHSKSRKMNEPFANLTSQEALRAMLKALAQGNNGVIEEMVRQLPKDTKKEANILIGLFMEKVSLYNSYLLLRANIAISFYNVFMGNTLGVEVNEKIFDTDFAIKTLKESDMIMKQIEEIDRKTKGELKIDYFEILQDTKNHFDYWMYIIKNEKFNTEKSRIELYK